MSKLRVFEAFAGVGTQSMALKRLGVDYEVVGIAEIDKFAIQSYMAIHGETKNYGDISKIDPTELPDMDLFTYSFPCQDLSISGKQRGMGEGTRSGLLYECEKVISTKKPKYLLLENVKNLVGKKFKPDFDKWLEWLESQGYSNYWQVLNAKDYGVPQNRERVFVVSILGNATYEFPDSESSPVKITKVCQSSSKGSQAGWVYSVNGLSPTLCAGTHGYANGLIMEGDYHFPEPIPLEIYLKDLLEDNVDEKYYLDNPPIVTFEDGKLRVKEATKLGYREAEEGDSINLEHPNSTTRIGRVGKEVAQTLTTSPQQVTIKDYRIRRLTPLECWRLMGIGDLDFYKVQGKGISDSQLYKQAGNAIVVDVLVGIFRNLFTQEYYRSHTDIFDLSDYPTIYPEEFEQYYGRL